MKITIEIAKSDSSWKGKVPSKKLMRDITCNIFNRFANLAEVRLFELSILLANDSEISKLNGEFRNKYHATNILSFPDIQLDWKHILEFKPNLNYMYLGDMVFCYQIIEKEAKSQNKLFEHHFIHLFVHGLLHLIGFDHTNEEEATVMENLEILILRDFSISSPYEFS